MSKITNCSFSLRFLSWGTFITKIHFRICYFFDFFITGKFFSLVCYYSFTSIFEKSIRKNTFYCACNFFCLLKLCNKCCECKSSIFMNINQLNVIHNSQTKFNEIKILKLCIYVDMFKTQT